MASLPFNLEKKQPCAKNIRNLTQLHNIFTYGPHPYTVDSAIRSIPNFSHDLVLTQGLAAMFTFLQAPYTTSTPPSLLGLIL